VLRGRSARAGEQESLASPFSSADGYALPPANEGVLDASLAPDADMGPLFASAAAREHETDDGSMFDVGEDEAMREEAKPEPAPYVAMSSAAAPASAPSYNASDLEGLDMRVIEELERRLAHLETRLEEVVDAKERLERHVAAQTEELRVQRAAIARTQRVLRGVVNPTTWRPNPPRRCELRRGRTFLLGNSRRSRSSPRPAEFLNKKVRPLLNSPPGGARPGLRRTRRCRGTSGGRR
jgi:hypothetical protein